MENDIEIKTDYTDKIKELLNLNEISDLVKTNEKVFEMNGKTYRIKKATYKQKQEAYKKKMEKYVDMLKDDKYPLEKDLIELYKKRNIDIQKMGIELQNKVIRRDSTMLKLGEVIKNNAIESELKVFKDEIESMNIDIQRLSIERMSYLESSIEQQVSIFIYSYFVYLLAEEKDGENWKKVWNTYEEFENTDSPELINRFSYYSTMMIGDL